VVVAVCRNRLKSPFLCSGVRTCVTVDSPRRCQNSSSLTKKKVFFSFGIGPPIFPPYWFWLYCGAQAFRVLTFGSFLSHGNPRELRSKKFRPCVLLFRLNSHRVPWNSRVPALVTTLTCAPAPFPNSAE